MTRVVVLGDSQAEGLIPHLREPLRAIGWTPVEPWAFYRGAGTPTLVGHLAEALAAAPDVVIVAAGGNDSATSDADARAWLELARRTLSTGAELVWITPPAAREPGSALDRARAATADAIARALAGRPGVSVVSGRALFDGLAHTDSVHYERDAYAEAARRLASQLAPGSRSPGRVRGADPAGLLLAAAGLAALVVLAARPPARAPRLAGSRR